MTSKLVHLTVRVPVETRESFEALATQQRMKTGENVKSADLIRDALALYLIDNKAKETR